MNDKLGLGIIGMGGVGRQHYQACGELPRIAVLAVAETSPSGDLAETVKVPIHADWRRLIDNDDIDAVSICLPHHLHAETTIAALQAGKHVLLEKPIAATADEARQIIDAARMAERALMIEMTHRFYTPVRAGRDLIRAGRLGRVFAVEDRIVAPVSRGQLPGWILERRFAGGGVALTNGIHMLDRIAWVCGQPLRFHDGVAGWTHEHGDVEDTASMQLSLADGSPAVLLASWPRGKGPSDDELTVYGTKGTLRVRAWRGWRFEPHDGPPEEESSYPERHDVPTRVTTGMTGALAEFAGAILERRTPRPSGEDVLPSQEIVEQFYQRTLRER